MKSETTIDTILSPHRRRCLGACAGLGALMLAGCGQSVSNPSRSRMSLQFGGRTMGTTYVVKLAGASLSRARREALHADVHSALDGIHRNLSVFRSDSELMRFNRLPAAVPMPLSKDLYEVLAVAQEVSVQSLGAFDVSVAPLVRAWGFGADARHDLPKVDDLKAQRAGVDHASLQLDAVGRIATKLRASFQADLGGIAKGHAVDLAGRALEANGVENYMIEVGGEVRTRGRNAQQRAWRIGIEQPDAVPPRARTVVPLAGQSMATSGDYRIYFEHDGQRYSHAIDPGTAAPVANGLASVTVIADDCVHADALATALIVLGPERGLALAHQLKLAALFIVREPLAGLHDIATPAFDALRTSIAA